MSYARTRLWLGILGVGSLVVFCTAFLILPPREGTLLDDHDSSFRWIELVGFIALLGIWQAPFDFLGGYWFPRRFRRSFDSLGIWLRSYLSSVLLQSLFFGVLALSILLVGQWFGRGGAIGLIAVLMLSMMLVRNRSLVRRQSHDNWSDRKLTEALKLVEAWGFGKPSVLAIRHRDIGFTGGIIGWGRSSKILIPQAWCGSMAAEQLATVIARRSSAIQSGSYSIGVATGIGWNLIGFAVCSYLPNAGVATVGQLLTTVCGFAIWSFAGLLVLPSMSRRASLQMDSLLHRRGISSDLIQSAAKGVDRLQDDEPSRPGWIETIFHPIPSVSRRNPQLDRGGWTAWHVARTTLFLSWACFGILSRAVHCNVGRPELWTMLPSD